MSTPTNDMFCIEDIQGGIGDYCSAMRTKSLPAFGGKKALEVLLPGGGSVVIKLFNRMPDRA